MNGTESQPQSTIINSRRTKRNPPLRVGIGGPVGSGKTTLVEMLCKSLRDRYDLVVITNDIYTKEDQRLLIVAGALPAERILGVETGGCPHTAIREDASINLEAVDRMLQRFPDADVVFIESGGDNLAATFSPELSDLTIYVIDVAGGEKIPRKGGPGITKSDLLVINKIDLAPYVGASLEVMESDARKMRGERPFVMCNLKEQSASEISVYRAKDCSKFGSESLDRASRKDTARVSNREILLTFDHDQFLTVCGGQTISSRAVSIRRFERFETWEENHFLFREPRDHTSGMSKDANILTTSGPGVPQSSAMLRMSSLKQSAKRQRTG